MAMQPDASPWLSFSLERVALVLGARFPGRYVWLVRPSQLHLHKFSCYTNFVSCDMFGAPKHSLDYGAVLHLRALLGHAMERAAIAEPLPPLGGSSVPASLPTGFSLILVGFSKGCVVLNQMVHELASVRTDPELRQFLDSISDMYWLDGGHPGTGDTWVTDKQALGELASSGVAVHAHVTPYEVCDPTRAWVGREHRCFVKTLEELGARITQNLHFEHEPACIANHFRVIEEFWVAQKCVHVARFELLLATSFQHFMFLQFKSLYLALVLNVSHFVQTSGQGVSKAFTWTVFCFVFFSLARSHSSSFLCLSQDASQAKTKRKIFWPNVWTFSCNMENILLLRLHS